LIFHFFDLARNSVIAGDYLGSLIAAQPFSALNVKHRPVYGDKLHVTYHWPGFSRALKLIFKKSSHKIETSPLPQAAKENCAGSETLLKYYNPSSRAERCSLFP